MSPDRCAICARTLAPDEPASVYLSKQGSRTVCARCAARAERIGWRTEAQAAAEEAVKEERGRLSRLLRRGAKPPPASDPEREDSARPAAAPEPDRSPDPAAPGARVERLEPAPSLASPVERALERFNHSEAGYTVEGLVRTLGPPWVSVGSSAGSASELRITVAWELSWYQWGVDLRDEQLPVVELAKGTEVDQLDAAARQWNAAVAKDGQIVLAPARERAAAERRAG